ncbi:hypothetical protein MBCUT_04930 [Methanobrevibacter cuticularis]|uniref:Methanogenesis regulatory protein FilR1 middle domain-containing protein n=1 Tax=Methanobrevibacter cuticularis TaxID=47311 RepID=A0A166EP77_9EURY|nr:transcriptional regulator FilR1 domain-containing protein [Methanobrevibacter cuticularis]KZX16863.1 hypothetical protein MBCUT_04930 [Methanobrevibacter cuticularis]
MIENNNCFKDYERIKKNIKFLTSSEIRLKLLNCLLEKPMSMKEMHIKTNLSYSSIASNIHKLEDNGYLTQKSKRYYMNNHAKMELLNLFDFNNSLDIINEFSNFWTDHEVQELPKNALMNIQSLKGSYLIESNPTDIYMPHNTFKNLLMNSSSNVKAIFPFLHPDYPNIFEKLLENGVNIKLLFVQGITANFIESMDQDIIRNGLIKETFKIRSLKNNIKISLSLSDDFLALGLFKKDNSYDQNRLIVSNTEEAIKWGNKIFEEHYISGRKLHF